MTTYDRACAGIYSPNMDHDLPVEKARLMQTMRHALATECGVTDPAEEFARWTVAQELLYPSEIAWNYSSRGPISLRVGQDTALAAVKSDIEPRSNPQLTYTTGAEVGIVTEIFPAVSRVFELPTHLAERPPCFPVQGGQYGYSPLMSTLTIRNGIYWNCAEVPVVLSGQAIVKDFSPVRAKLAQAYDIDANTVLQNAVPIEGPAIVLQDYGPAFNICHWTADWMTRSATVDAEKCTAIVPILTQQWQRDMLQKIGFRRVVEVPRHTAVIAEELIVTSDQRDVAHPASKAAPWAVDYMRQKLSNATPWEWPNKIYVSRDDALGRKMLNEKDLLADYLEPLGYTKVTLSRLSLAHQIGIFGAATHVVGMHGAGLTHLIYAKNLQSVVEIFAGEYGTPAFYVFAAASGARYATYKEPSIIRGERPQLDSINLNIKDFMARTVDRL